MTCAPTMREVYGMYRSVGRSRRQAAWLALRAAWRTHPRRCAHWYSVVDKETGRTDCLSCGTNWPAGRSPWSVK